MFRDCAWYIIWSLGGLQQYDKHGAGHKAQYHFTHLYFALLVPVICGDTKEEHDISILRLWDRQCGLDRGRTVLIARDQISSQLSLPSDSLI